MHRVERFAWIMLGYITATLVLIGTAIVSYEYVGHRRIVECQDQLRDQGVPPGGDEWARCDSRGDWGN